MNGNATVVAESFMSQTRLDQPFCVVPWTPPQPKEGPKLPKAPPRLRSWPDWRCQICRADKTPERRAGPTGKNTLCNACGLRYKKEAQDKHFSEQRRRREREQLRKMSVSYLVTDSASDDEKDKLGIV